MRRFDNISCPMNRKVQWKCNKNFWFIADFSRIIGDIFCLRLEFIRDLWKFFEIFIFSGFWSVIEFWCKNYDSLLKSQAIAINGCFMITLKTSWICCFLYQIQISYRSLCLTLKFHLTTFCIFWIKPKAA